MKSLKWIDRALVGMAVVVMTMTLATAGLTVIGEYQRLQRLSVPDTGTKPDSAKMQHLSWPASSGSLKAVSSGVV